MTNRRAAMDEAQSCLDPHTVRLPAVRLTAVSATRWATTFRVGNGGRIHSRGRSATML